MIAARALLLTALPAVWGMIMVNTPARNKTINGYLTPYGEEAVAYLTENEAFADAYGEVSLHVKGYTYSYLAPRKYAPLPFRPD